VNGITRWQAGLALLLILSAGVFVVGVVVERSQPAEAHHEAQSQTTTTTPSETGGEGNTTESPAQSNGEATTTSEAKSEKVFGFNPDSAPLVAAVLIASVVLALAVGVSDAALLLIVIVGFTLGAAAFDGREALLKLDESRTLVASLAVIVGVLHLAAASIAALALFAPRRLATAA
jgi:hypothetical protein